MLNLSSTLRFLTSVAVVSLHIPLSLPAHAGFFDDAWNEIENLPGSVSDEVENCVIHGGCDPTNTTVGDTVFTVSGGRGTAAAYSRFLNRQVRVNVQPAMEQAQADIKRAISEGFTCIELVPDMTNFCTELNQWLDVDMQFTRYSLPEIGDLYGDSSMTFVENCLAELNLPVEDPTSFQCIDLGSFN